MNENLKQLTDWVNKYKKRLERGDFDNLTKFRKREWECTYSLAIDQIEREKEHGS